MVKEEVKEEVKEVVATSTPEANEALICEKVYWEDLVTARTEAVKSIIGQQAMVVTLAEAHVDTIEKDKDLAMEINGLMKSFKDIAKTIGEISKKHTVDGNFKTGLISTTNDEMSYIEIGAEYITAQEKVAHLSTTGFLDIFTKFKVDTSELQKLNKELEKIEAVKNGK